MQEPLRDHIKRAARNEMEGFCLGVSPRSTERNVKLETRGSPHGLHTVDFLTEPQGKIKK